VYRVGYLSLLRGGGRLGFEPPRLDRYTIDAARLRNFIYLLQHAAGLSLESLKTASWMLDYKVMQCVIASPGLPRRNRPAGR